jgi:hypothetical protein
VERDPSLCDAGAILAGDLPQRFVAADVLCDPLDALPDEAAIVGLHACGRLGDAALRRARARLAPVALAPCCYHNSRRCCLSRHRCCDCGPRAIRVNLDLL